MSEENHTPHNPPIDIEPVSNGINKLSIEIPSDGKKNVELVFKDNKVINQKSGYGPEIISNKKVEIICEIF